MSTPEDSITVRYTAKELFARIDNKLDQIVTKLDEKADDHDVVQLRQRVEVLETWKSEQHGFGAAQKAIVVLLLAIAGLLIPIVVHYL